MKAALKITLVLAFYTGCCLAGFAQGKVSPQWSTKFAHAINWQRIHNLGYVIVSTNDGLYGIDPLNGKILWENKKFASLDPSLFSEVPGTELIAIAYNERDDDPSTIPMQAIVDVISGKVLFDSRKEEIGVLSLHVLPQSSRLLIVGASEGVLAARLFMFDIGSGSQLWKNEDLFKVESTGTGFFSKLQAGLQSLSNLQGLLADPVELNDGSMLLLHPNMVLKVNGADGKVVWKNDLQPSQAGRLIFSPYKKNVVFVATEFESEYGSGFTSGSSGSQGSPNKFTYNQYYAFDLQSGKPLWKNPAKEEDKLNVVIMHEAGIIVCPQSTHKPTINLIDYNSGQTMWGKKAKGIKAQGSVVSYIETEKGILITTGFDNAFTNKGEEYYLNILNPSSGTLAFEKSIKLKGDVVQSELTPKGLLFATTREVNILDVSTGNLFWDKSIEAGGPASGEKVRPFPIGQRDNKLFVFSPKEEGLFEIDKIAGTYRKVSLSKLGFEGKELPRAIDALPDGVVIYSEQNIAKFDTRGSVIYHSYYPAPRQPALMRALLAAEAVRAAYIGAAASTYSAAFADASQKSSDPTAKAVTGELSQAYGDLGKAGFAYSGQALKQFNARFKASQNTPGYLMMMTVQEKNGNQLIQVSKETGTIQNRIDIKNDREPEYEIDEIFNHVYYRASPTELVCYKL